jgi:hypothetical protein
MNKLWSLTILSLLVIVSLIYYSVNEYYIYLVLYAWFGVAYGMFLQYGRFCMASTFRDLFGLGSTRMFAGIMIAIVIFSIIMAFLESIRMSTFHPGPIGGYKIIGGLIFGMGMVTAGGCASGTLYKCGEGNGTSMLSLFAISISQAVFVNAAGLFDKYMELYIDKLPRYMLSNDLFNRMSPPFNYFVGNALVNSFIPAMLLLWAVYIIWGRKTVIKQIIDKETGKRKERLSFRDELTGFWMMLGASKKTVIAGLMLGIIAGVNVWAIFALRRHFNIENFGELLVKMGHVSEVNDSNEIFDPGYWYITTQEAQFGAWLLKLAGIDTTGNGFFRGVAVPSPLRNPALWMSVGIIAGAAVLSVWNREFKFKPPRGEFIVWGLAGGTLMGLGARLGMGCNIGSFFIKVAGGDPGGWLFGLGLAGGAFIGVRFFDWWTTRKLNELEDF